MRKATKVITTIALLAVVQMTSAWFWQDGNTCSIATEGIGCGNPGAACTGFVWNFSSPWNVYDISGHCYDSNSNGGEWLRGCMCT